MELSAVKDSVEILRNCLLIVGFFLAVLYFFYRLLAGFLDPCRLVLELACDNPFADKTLVRANIKLKNTGPASIRITDAGLWAFTFDGNDSETMQVWPKVKPTSDDEARPHEKHLSMPQLDFQRLGLDLKEGTLMQYQARDVYPWINLETAGERQRQFLLKLPVSRRSHTKRLADIISACR